MFQKFEIVELPGRAPQNCWEPNFHTHNCQWVALLFVKVSCDLEQTSNVTILGFYVILYPICSSLFHKNCRTTHQKNQIILSRWLHKGSLTSLPLGENTTSRRVSTFTCWSSTYQTCVSFPYFWCAKSYGTYYAACFLMRPTKNRQVQFIPDPNYFGPDELLLMVTDGQYVPWSYFEVGNSLWQKKAFKKRHQQKNI